jgi:CRP/FNR family transcriptional regulator
MRRILCENCAIRDTGIIADLPVEKLDEFRACSVTAIYKPRQVVFHEGTSACGLYILCHGAVKLYQSDRFGRDHILGVAGPGDVLGELPVDPTESYSTSAEVLTESQLCYLPRERLVQFIQLHPMTGVRLIAALSTALGAARKKVRDLALKPAETRLAELLVQLARSTGRPAQNGATRVILRYSRREIAEMIGISTETAIRLLGRLKKKRVITVHQRELVISDVEKLMRFANQGSVATS